MKTFSQYSSIFDNVGYNDTSVQASSISYYPDFYVYKNYYLKFLIEPKYQFRPDKIAYMLWNNQSLSWVLDAINNFTSLSEYYIAREIYYLNSDFLVSLGIL
jgi:hypothetical protein